MPLLMLPPLFMNNSRISIALPAERAAQCMGVTTLSLSHTFGSAPRERRIEAHLLEPFSAAQCSMVLAEELVCRRELMSVTSPSRSLRITGLSYSTAACRAHSEVIDFSLMSCLKESAYEGL